MTGSWRRRIAGLVATLSAASLCGCQLIAYPFIVFGKEPTKKVPAEYDKLGGRRVVILVWADNETLFNYPFAQFEVATWVGTELTKHVKGIKIVEPQKVSDYQRRTYQWQTQPMKQVGRVFNADVVLYIELLEYSTRQPDAPDLYRGRIRSTVTVYDLSGEKPNGRRIDLSPAIAVYPEGKPVGILQSTDDQVRAAAMAAFGQAVARKFYTHEIKL